MFRLIQISDTHLGEGVAASAPGWEAALGHIARSQAELVVHSGDIVASDPRLAGEHDVARAEFARVGVPLRAIPGNHDIGDGPPAEPTVTPELIAQFEAFYGPSRWLHDIPGWRLVGINSLLLGSGLAAEAGEWAFIEAALATSPANLALFMHKPPFILAPDEAAETRAAIPHAARRRFWSLATAARVRLIATGHRHEYRVVHRDGIGIVWCPATTFAPEQTPPLRGSGEPGLVEYVFDGDSIAHTCIRLG
jgi:3',5'-cyclic AMP phosphodiesterase CpdA